MTERERFEAWREKRRNDLLAKFNPDADLPPDADEAFQAGYAAALSAPTVQPSEEAVLEAAKQAFGYDGGLQSINEADLRFLAQHLRLASGQAEAPVRRIPALAELWK